MFVSCYISHVSLSSFLTHVTDARFRDVVHVARCCAPFRDVVRVSQHCQAQKWKLLEHAMLKTKTAALRRWQHMWILRRVPKTVHSKAPACVKLDNILLVARWDSKTNRSDTKPMVLGESPIGNRERMKLPLPPFHCMSRRCIKCFDLEECWLMHSTEIHWNGGSEISNPSTLCSPSRNWPIPVLLGCASYLWWYYDGISAIVTAETSPWPVSEDPHRNSRGSRYHNECHEASAYVADHVLCAMSTGHTAPVAVCIYRTCGYLSKYVYIYNTYIHTKSVCFWSCVHCMSCCCIIIWIRTL